MNPPINDISELDCYENILKYFQKDNRDSIKTEIWKNKSYIKIMEKLKDTNDRIITKNALILILSLFEDNPPDFYTNKGFNLDNLSEEDRKVFLNKLKEEFYSREF